MNLDEFVPSRTLDLDTRINAIEMWASLFSGRQSVDPSAVEATDGGGTGGGAVGGPGNLIGDVTGATTANTVGRLRGKPLTGTETAGYVYSYDGTNWVAQNYVSGRWGVGLSTNPSFKLQVDDFPYTTWFDGQNSNAKSGSRGWHQSKDKTTAFPNVVTFHSDGAPCWDIGMDFDTNNAFNAGFGNADLVLAYDYSANANAGADIFRISPEEAHGGTSSSVTSKWQVGRAVGTPRNNTAFWTFDGGDDTNELGGVLVRHFGGATANGIAIVTRATANNRCVFSLGDATETMWVMGVDAAAANDKNYYVFDTVNGATRMFLKSVAGNLGANGFGTTNPQGIVSSGGSAAAAQYDVRQRYFIGSTTDDPGSRSVNIEGIRDATVGNTVNYLFLMGGLGGGSTAALRKTTSSSSALGLEATDTLLSVVAAGTGSNQTILRPMTFDAAGNIGVFGATPVGQQAGASAAGLALIVDPNAAAAITALQNALYAAGWVTAPA